MAPEPATPTAPPFPDPLKRREAERQQLREAEFQDALQELHERHKEERLALSQELLELAKARKAIQNQLWANKSSQQGDGASSSAAAAALNGSELLPARSEVHVEVQRLLEILDERELRRVYDYRIKVEDPHEIRARQRTEAARRAGLWRFVSKKKVEAKRKVVEQKGTASDDIAHVNKKKLGRPKFPECYEEIKNLLDIEKNPIFSKALQEWNRKEEWYTRWRVELNQAANVKNEVYQLLGFFSVFQGVVLTAVSTSSLLYCHNVWSPIALSVLASVLCIFGVIQKWNQINDLQLQSDKGERAFTTAMQVGQRLQELGPKGTDFVQLNAEIARNANRKSRLSKKIHLGDWVYSWVAILAFVAFGVLFPTSFWRILCNPGSPPAQ